MVTVDIFKEILEEIRENGNEEHIECLERQIEILEKKAAKAKEKLETKRAEGDALRERIFNLIGDEPKTLETILEELDDEELTKSKIVPKMTQLVNADRVEKIEMKVPGGKKMGYRLFADGAI